MTGYLLSMAFFMGFFFCGLYAVYRRLRYEDLSGPTRYYALFFIVGLVYAVGGIGVIESQYGALATFDGDGDRVDRDVNNSWIALETGNWSVDPSDTSPDQVKLEQDGKGIVILEPTVLSPVVSDRYHTEDVDWSDKISQLESRGFVHESGPELVESDGRQFWSIKFSHQVTGSEAYAYFLSTKSSESQYTFIYSFTEDYVDEGHFEEVLSMLASSEFKNQD